MMYLFQLLHIWNTYMNTVLFITDKCNSCKYINEKDKQSKRYLVLPQGSNSISEGIKKVMTSSPVKQYWCKR